MCSVLKFNSSNSRSGSPKCWRIVGLSGTSREVEIFTVEGYNLTNLSWYRLKGYCAELLWVSSLCSYFAVNHFLDVAVDIFLTQTTKYISEQWMYICTSLCVEKPGGLMLLNHSVERISWSPMSDHHNNPLKMCFTLAAFIQWPGYKYRFVKSNGFTLPLKF